MHAVVDDFGGNKFPTSQLVPEPGGS
jgi:hypothetical protein